MKIAPRPRRAALLGALALLGAMGALPSRAAAQAGRPEVLQLRFRGNEAFPDDSLARAIVTRQTECRSAVFQLFCWAGADFAIQRAWLPRREFLLDPIRLKVWYQQRGYREANIDTETNIRQDGKVFVTFLVKEGEPVRVDSVAYAGTEGLGVPDLLHDLPLRRGAPLSAIALDATRDTLASRLTNHGYARAEVLRSFRIGRADPTSAVVTFDVAAGPRSRYGDISVEGERELSVSTVLRTIQFRSGDVYRASQLQEAQARLFGLELIRSASVTPDFETGPDSVIPVAVRVQEGDLRRVRAGAGWSSSECMDVDARWVHRNFFGGGRRVQVRGRLSNILARDFRDLLCWQQGAGSSFTSLTWIASVDFAQPWVFSTRNALQASLYAERQSLPNVFVRQAVGASFALTRSVAPRTPLTLSYRPELSRLDAAEILFCTSFLVCTPQDISVLQGANWLAPVGLTLSRNATNNVLNPSRGYTALMDVEYGDRLTGSEFTYTRVQGDVARFARLPGGSVLAGRMRLGWVSAGAFHLRLEGDARADLVHPQKRFYAGGANSVRGYAQSRLGPRVLTAGVKALLQPRSPDPTVPGGAGCTPESIVDLSCDASPLGDQGFLARPTGGNKVMEGSLEARFPLSSTFQGAIFTDVGQVWDAGADVDLASLRVTPGFGIRYLSPIGPLRLDVAYRFAGGESLKVLTDGVRPFVPGTDDERDRLEVAGEPIPWVTSRALAALSPRVLYDDSPAMSLRRWQLHISIGQAF